MSPHHMISVKIFKIWIIKCFFLKRTAKSPEINKKKKDE